MTVGHVTLVRLLVLGATDGDDYQWELMLRNDD